MNLKEEPTFDARFRPRTEFSESPVIKNIEFDVSTLREEGIGSDNWPITWADDDHQYTSFGDGCGFGATDWDEQSGPDRVGMGFGRVEGPKDGYTVVNVGGGKNSENPPSPLFDRPAGIPHGNKKGWGKCYGLISVDGVIYAWRIGDGQPYHMAFSELVLSRDHCKTWEAAGVRFDREGFANKRGFFAPTFVQCGKDNTAAPDAYVYTCAPEISPDEGWEVQIPGRIFLFRAPASRLTDRAACTFFAGFDRNQRPIWSEDVEARAPVFEDRANGVMRTSVCYHPGLQRYLLATQQVSRLEIRNGHIGIYDAPAPWGPWSRILCRNAWTAGTNGRLNRGYKNVFYNFSPKWFGPDNRSFVLVYTGPSHDQWGTVEGRFILR